MVFFFTFHSCRLSDLVHIAGESFFSGFYVVRSPILIPRIPLAGSSSHHIPFDYVFTQFLSSSVIEPLNLMTMPAASLAVDVVNRVIDEVLTGTTPPHHVDGCFQRVVTEKDWKTLAALAGSSTSIAAKEGIVGAVPNIPFYFGIQATVNTNVVAFITFHIAYSTWDGRMTYVDKLVCVEDTTSNTSSTNGLEVTLYRLLAKVTVSIGCERLTWKVR